MKTAMVTGGAGFIGSHLVDRLLADRWRVRVVDDMSSGTMANLAQHKNNFNITVRRKDIRRVDSIGKFMKGCDAVFHFAAHADIRSSLRNRAADLENNLIGTLSIIEAMQREAVPDLVFASTSAIYGETSVHPTPEDHLSLQTSLYGASKLACEAFAEAYTQFSPIRFWAFRFANVVGERCRRGVVWDFTKKLLSNPRELEILGDGKQSREFLYVGDCVNGFMSGYEKGQGNVNVFNLGLQGQTTVDEVANIVIEELGLSSVEKRYTGGIRGWVGDNPIVVLDLRRIMSLGWKPKLSGEEAIRRTVRWSTEILGRRTGDGSKRVTA